MNSNVLIAKFIFISKQSKNLFKEREIEVTPPCGQWLMQQQQQQNPVLGVLSKSLRQESGSLHLF